MGGQRFAFAFIESVRLIKQQFRQAAGSEPRKAAPVADAAEGKSAVALETMPAEHGRVSGDAGHRLHRVTHDFTNMSDVNHSVAKVRSGQQLVPADIGSGRDHGGESGPDGS